MEEGKERFGRQDRRDESTGVLQVCRMRRTEQREAGEKWDKRFTF